MTAKKVKTKLRGHEKFFVREGWISKGLEAVSKDSRIFLDGQGSDKLGVGNNMVKSIRYWLRAFKLTEETARSGANLTEFGKVLFKKDPYLEDMTSLWALHSAIAKNLEEASIWKLYFFQCDMAQITKDEITNFLIGEYENLTGGETYSKKSLRDDVDVLLRMYCSEKERNPDPEDKNRSPFAQLGLIVEQKGTYSRRQPDLRKLSWWMILMELAELMMGENMITIDELEERAGKIYNLSRMSINYYLDRIEQAGYIQVVRTAGLDSIYKKKELGSPTDILEKYYEDRT